MGRVIEGTSVSGDFLPLVGIRNKGNSVKGKVTKLGNTANGNPVVNMTLMDLNGSTVVGEGKGNYREVEVNIGDEVQIIGSVKQLREKLPQLQVGDVVTITNTSGRKKIAGNKTTYEFLVEVED